MAKTWLITGTSTGLGRLLTERLLERGDHVIATLRRKGSLDDLLDLHGDRLQILTFDVTDTQTMRDTVSQAFTTFGRIDVVVSNAGYGLFGAAEEASDTQIERQIATNLTGSIQFIRAVLPYLREQGVAASFRYRLRAARLPIQASAFITPRSGASKGSSNP
ncbi:hypothetical protein HORIV_13080 [Vreelandella olivaria]|uniref:Uncharacterized protein n=1 Tax=Vreelandella olivaria TaxID=390919 RepID=A0ABN5WWP3_9GAMM|nr:hypothetical protein HORIV_13080 [Halomonas olivaria]